MVVLSPSYPSSPLLSSPLLSPWFLLRPPSQAARPTAKCAAKSKAKSKGRPQTRDLGNVSPKAETPGQKKARPKTGAPKAKAKASCKGKASPKAKPSTVAAKKKPKVMPKKVATAKPKATPKKKAKELKQDGNNIYSRAYHKAKREGSGKEEAGLFFKKQPWQSDFHAANHIKSVFFTCSKCVTGQTSWTWSLQEGAWDCLSAWQLALANQHFSDLESWGEK